MQNLTPEGQRVVAEVAQRYNLSQDAVIHMLVAVNNGGGTMAQFSSPELGGSGQWMRGGMTMTGDMFNHGLQATVDNLCNELSNALANNQMFPVIPAGTPGSAEWWPQSLGVPFSSGAQNNIRYAVFAGRLAVESFGAVTVYDTLDHQIGGVSQQQGGDSSLTFSSQYGTISVNSLPVVSGTGSAPAPQTNFAAPQVNAPMNEPVVNEPVAPAMPMNTPPTLGGMGGNTDEAFALLEKLASLKDAGVITVDEFNAKKSELLNRI